MRTRAKLMIAGATALGLAGIAPAAFAASAPPAGWHVVASPNPGGSAVLAGVTAATRANFWAAGTAIGAGNTSNRPLLLHQTGTGPWKVVDVPALRVAGGFAAVSAHGPNDIWAVGGLGTPPLGTLTAHFDGHTWKVVPAPSVAAGRLTAVSTLSPSNAWAVGTRQTATGSATLVEHWNGTAWSVVPSPSPDSFSGLAGVVAIAPNDVWAVGHSGDEFVLPVVEHWDGHVWSVVTVPVPTPHAELIGLQAISAVNAHDIWAVGQGNLTEHFDGHAWTAITAPSASTDPDSSSVLNGVSARSAKDVWAVGSVSAPAGPLAVTEHWDGLKWTVVTTGLPTTSAILNAVAAPPGGPSVAVGYHLSTTDTTLILRNAR